MSLKYIRNYFTAMDFSKKIFRYKVAVGLVNKQLREEVLINGKPMTQNYLNNDIDEKYGKSWNSGREESLPNTTLENILLVCDYFRIDIQLYFSRIDTISPEEVDATIESKSKIKRLYSSY